MPHWLTYREIAERLGITRGAAKMLVSRRGWDRQPPNKRGGIIRVLVPDDFDIAQTGHGGYIGHNPAHVPTSEPTGTSVVPSDVPTVPTPRADLIPTSVLEQVLADRDRQHEQLRVDYVRQIADRDAIHARHLAERDALHLDLIGRIQAQASAERGLFLERVDAAELRAEAAEARATAVDEKLHQVLDRLLERPLPTIPAPPQPWWARWFGQTKRSNIGG